MLCLFHYGQPLTFETSTLFPLTLTMPIIFRLNHDCPTGHGHQDLMAQLVAKFYAERCPKCAIGTIRNNQMKTCTPCPAMTYPDLKQKTCLRCAPGTQASRGSSICVKCQPGSFRGSKNSVCRPCPAMTYPNQHSQTKCLDCPPGTRSFEGSSACVPCESNTYRSKEAQCVACPVGYRSIRGSTHLSNCTVESFFTVATSQFQQGDILMATHSTLLGVITKVQETLINSLHYLCQYIFQDSCVGDTFWTRYSDYWDDLDEFPYKGSKSCPFCRKKALRPGLESEKV